MHMANIQTRTTADNRVMYTTRIRIKGFPQQTATFSRLTDAKQWAQKTEARIREGMHFSQAEAKRHTFTEMVQRYTRTVLTNKSETIQYQYAQQLSKWSSLKITWSVSDCEELVLSFLRTSFCTTLYPLWTECIDASKTVCPKTFEIKSCFTSNC